MKTDSQQDKPSLNDCADLKVIHSRVSRLAYDKLSKIVNKNGLTKSEVIRIILEEYFNIQMKGGKKI